LAKEYDPEEIPYDLLDRDARRRRLAEESRKQDFRHRSEHFQELEREKRSIRLRTRLAVIAVIMSFLAAGLLYARNYRMNTYSVDAEISEKGLSGSGLYSFGNGAVILSRDSVQYFEEDRILWSVPLSFSDGQIAVREPYFTVYKRGGTEAMVFDDTGLLSEVSLSREIRAADISASGVTALVSESGDAAYISYFDRFGNRVSVEAKTLISQSGYPVDIAISPDGQRLAVAFYSLAKGIGKSRLVLYDFRRGTENASYIVGTIEDFGEADPLLLDVFFLSDTSLAAVGDDLLTVAACSENGMETLLSRPLGADTVSVFPAESFAVLAESAGGETRVRLIDEDGKEAYSVSAEVTRAGVCVSSSRVLFRREERIVMANLSGMIRYEGELTGEPGACAFIGSRGILLEDDGVLRKITLK